MNSHRIFLQWIHPEPPDYRDIAFGRRRLHAYFVCDGSCGVCKKGEVHMAEVEVTVKATDRNSPRAIRRAAIKAANERMLVGA